MRRAHLETAGGQLVPGAIDACAQPIEPKQVSLRFGKTDGLLGVTVAPQQQVKLLTSLGLEYVDGHEARFSIPTWRVDLKREWI